MQHKPRTRRYPDPAAGCCTPRASTPAMLSCPTLAGRGATGWSRLPPKARPRVLAAATIPHGRHHGSVQVGHEMSYNQVIYPLPSRSRCFDSRHRNSFLSNSTTSTVNLFIFSFGAGRLLGVFPVDQEWLSQALPSPGQAMPAETDCAYLTIYHCYIRAHSRAVIHLLKLQVSVEELF